MTRAWDGERIDLDERDREIGPVKGYPVWWTRTWIGPYEHEAWSRKPAACFCTWNSKDTQESLNLRGRIEIFRAPDRHHMRVHVEKVVSYDGAKLRRAEREGQDVWGSAVD